MIADAHQERIRELEARLEESEDTLAAIRRGDFDAVVVRNPLGEPHVYTLENADRPYRVLIEQIQEGALTLSLDGAVLYCNRRLADMLEVGQEQVIGRVLRELVADEDRPSVSPILRQAQSRLEATGCRSRSPSVHSIAREPRRCYAASSLISRRSGATCRSLRTPMSG